MKTLETVSARNAARTRFSLLQLHTAILDDQNASNLSNSAFGVVCILLSGAQQGAQHHVIIVPRGQLVVATASQAEATEPNFRNASCSQRVMLVRDDQNGMIIRQYST